MIRLQSVTAADRQRLWNLNQKYLYEMTNYYDDELDAEGNLHYGYFDEYFVDPRRSAFFICSDETTVGFAMLNPYSNFDRRPDHVMAEFTIFPAFRRKHYALEAARLILDSYPGEWEIKYNEKNSAAKALWTKVTEPYRPEKRRFSECEMVLLFNTLCGPKP